MLKLVKQAKRTVSILEIIPNWIKSNTRTYIYITVAIVVVVMSGVNYFEQQAANDTRISQAKTVLEQKQSTELEKKQKSELENSIKNEISSKIKVEVSFDRLAIDSNGNTKAGLVIRNNSDYQIDKMNLRIALKDANGNTVDDYDCEILQPINAHGLLGDTVWMKAKGVVDQKTNIVINEYSKPAQ